LSIEIDIRMKEIANPKDTTRSCPEAVIIKAHTSGAYLSNITLDNK